MIAGPHVRAACKRHLRDLDDGQSRGLEWRPELADRVFRYFRQVLRLIGGQHEGQPFELQPWQKFVAGSLFGWLRDGRRRFRIAYVETGKGSGKTPLSAGLGLYMMTADNEPRAEAYAAASKKDQAMILFRDAVAMVEQSPDLSARLVKSGGNPVWNLTHLPTGSFFRPISSDDGQSGPRPHYAALDEYHEHKTAYMVEIMIAGTKGRRQPLIFIITNSGFDRASPCYARHEYATKVAAGDVQDDALFAYVCALDEGDDPLADAPDKKLGYPRCWAKANPSIGVTFPPKYLEDQVREARGMPGKVSIVLRLNFCVWVDAENPWIDGDVWRACEVDSIHHAGPTFLGLDLSGKQDLLAAARASIDGDDVIAECRFWTPADSLLQREQRDRVPYSAWVRDGHLVAVPGLSIDFDVVVRDLADAGWFNDAVALAFDPYRMEDFLRALDRAGIDAYIRETPDSYGSGIALIRHGQGFGGGTSDSTLWMPRSIDELAQRVLSGRFRVRRNPVLTYASASAVLEQDAAGNQKWEKRKSTGRIDGIVATSMSVGCAVVTAEKPSGSVYDERGVIII